MRATPATTGTTVLTIGTKRASTMVLGPCRSKNAWVRSIYAGLMIFASGLRPTRGPTISPIVNPAWPPCIAATKQPTSKRQVQRALARQQSGGEHQRVARKEEADQQAGLRED